MYSVVASATGERSSTIGISVNKFGVNLSGTTNYKRSQHYGRFNASLTDAHEIECGIELVKQLNKGNENE